MAQRTELKFLDKADSLTPEQRMQVLERENQQLKTRINEILAILEKRHHLNLAYLRLDEE